MTPNLSKQSRLEDAIYTLSMMKDVPDAEALEAVIRDYPEFADTLTDFAIEMAIDAIDDGVEPIEEGTGQSEAVTNALSRFQNKLHQRKTEDAASAGKSAVGHEAINPFRRLDRTGYRDLVKKLGANVPFVNKLRDRQVDGDTMTLGFKHRLAEDLEVPLEVIVAHFASGLRGGAPQMYKAKAKPNEGSIESFEHAVRNSGLTEAQQRALLAL